MSHLWIFLMRKSKAELVKVVSVYDVYVALFLRNIKKLKIYQKDYSRYS